MSNMNDDFWNSSSSRRFNFDDEDDYWTDNEVANSNTIDTKEESDIYPIESLVSKSCLDLLLNDVECRGEWATLPVEESIKKMQLNQYYILEVYRKLHDKLSLLDAALNTWNGSIILEVVLFLRRTLKPNIFFNQLAKRKVALRQYSSYLRIWGKLDELENLYMATGHVSNIKDIYFLHSKDSLTKLESVCKLDQFLQSNSQYLNSYNEKNEFKAHLEFLEWQVNKKENSESVIDQLAVLCERELKYNRDDKIIEFRNLFRIDDFQYDWTVMNVLASLGSWKTLISTFIKRNWMTKRNFLKTSINAEIFIQRLSCHDAPKNVLEQFLNTLSDIDGALIVAEKLKCYKFMIEQYINRKDRVALLNCQIKVIPNSEEYYLIKNAIDSHKTQWKN